MDEVDGIRLGCDGDEGRSQTGLAPSVGECRSVYDDHKLSRTQPLHRYSQFFPSLSARL
jgi:hypothetical protein